MLNKTIVTAMMVGGCVAAAAPSFAQTAAAPTCCDAGGADFPKVGGSYGNQNYSALNAINKTNVGNLGGAWVNHLEGGSTAQFQQNTVVAVGGVLFVETTQGNVYAVDGATGAVKWSYKPGFGTLLRRGVAVGDGKVYTNAAGQRVIALDQNTGAVVWSQQLPEGNPGMKVAITYFDHMIYVGTDDVSRGIGYGIDATSGNVIWKFYGTPSPGEFGNDTWAGTSYLMGGASPWQHPAIDPKLGLIYWTFGDARNGTLQAVDGSGREGTNLFANSIVALDLKTGVRKWHFQSIHHDIWDMDNVMAPVLADVKVAGVTRQIVVYGSKTAMFYILDRATGLPVLGIDEVPVPQEPTQHTWPTQPIPRGDSLIPLCPGGTNPAPPNYIVGCLFTPHTTKPVLQSPGTGGGNAWSHLSFSPRTGYIYVGQGLVNSAHDVPDGGVGFRPTGEYLDGKIVALNPATNRIVWQKQMGWSLAHGNGILTTAGDVMFIGQPDGNILGLDITNGRELWRFQTGAGVHSSPITYQVNGVQYVAVFAGGNSLPYNDQKGDALWAFKVGGTVAQAAPAAIPNNRVTPSATSVAGTAVNNTVVLARTYTNGVVGTTESGAQTAMAPQVMTIPRGTTVTFTNPVGNASAHCATQFFEGLFNTGPLQPGQSFSYTFNTSGRYFYNDCTNPGDTGLVIVN